MMKRNSDLFRDVTKKVLFIFQLSVLIVLLTAAAWGNTYYVDNTGGNDSNNGLSTGAAWETIQKACETLIAGDTAFIRSGVYAETSSIGYVESQERANLWSHNSGSAGNYIVYKGYPGDVLPIIKGDYGVYAGEGDPTGGVYSGVFEDQQYIVFDSLEFRHGLNGVTVYFGHNCILRWCTVDSCGYNIGNNNVGGFHTRHIGTGDVTNMLVEYCKFFDNYDHGGANSINTGGIYIYVCDNCEFAYNEIYRTGQGIIIKGPNTAGTNITEHMEIHNNIIYSAGEMNNGIYLLKQGTERYINVYNNIIYGEFNEAAMKLHDAVVGSQHILRRVNIYNNTIDADCIYEDDSDGLINSVQADAGLDSIYIFNNILANYDHSGLEIGFDNDAITTFYENYNLLFDTQGNDFIEWSGNTYNLSEWRAATTFGDNTIEGDPLFVNRTTHNYHLSAGSPAIDGGRGGSWPTYIGAYEYEGEDTSLSQTITCTDTGYVDLTVHDNMTATNCTLDSLKFLISDNNFVATDTFKLVATTDTSYQFTSLFHNTEYKIKVVGYADAETNTSNTLTITTLTIPDTTISQVLSEVDKDSIKIDVSNDYTLVNTVVDTSIFYISSDTFTTVLDSTIFVSPADPKTHTPELLTYETNYQMRVISWDESAGVTDTSNILHSVTDAGPSEEPPVTTKYWMILK